MHAKAELLAELNDLESLLVSRLQMVQKQSQPIPTPLRSRVLPPTVEAAKCAGLGLFVCLNTSSLIHLRLRLCQCGYSGDPAT